MGILDNKVAIVTGGDSGIGHAICYALAVAGAAVTINYHKNEAAAEATQAHITREGGRAQIIQGDVSSTTDVQAIIGCDLKSAFFGSPPYLSAGSPNPARLPIWWSGWPPIRPAM